MNTPGPATSGPTATDSVTAERKDDHLRLARDQRMQLGARHFDDYAFEHNALPELDLDDVDVSVDFLGRRLAAPVVVSCMTGGTEEGRRINRRLAHAAEALGFAVGVGSQRAAVEDPSLAATYAVRKHAPNVPVLANLGAVQLNYGFGPDECRRAVEMIEADALVLHLNVLQEALQPEGQTKFRGLLAKMGEVADALPVPVIAKEVGMGISSAVGRALTAEGIRIVDAAGSGGTSWARIEAHRDGEQSTGEAFADWGIPTPEAIRQLAGVEGLTVIGSGGLRSGVDVAKALALGAHLAGMAYPFLMAADRSAEDVLDLGSRFVRELKVAMLCVGARDLEELRATPLRKRRRPRPLRIL